MTIIAEKFKELINDRIEKAKSPSRLNLILLKEKFHCVICYRTSSLASSSGGFWGVDDGSVSKLKSLGIPYIFVFLIAQDAGYILKAVDSDDFYKQCSQDKKRNYKIHKDRLRSVSSVFQFRTFDEFIDYLSLYKIK